MRSAGPALAFIAAILVVPSAIVAQQPIVAPPPVRPTMRPNPQPSFHPGPHRPPGHTGYGPGNGSRYGTSSGVLIDSSVVDRFLRTPVPVSTPRVRTKSTPRQKDAPDVFEQHSTSDNKP